MLPNPDQNFPHLVLDGLNAYMILAIHDALDK